MKALMSCGGYLTDSMGDSMKRVAILLSALLVVAGASYAGLFGSNKYEKEVETETSAVNLAREAASGGYQLVTTAELKGWMDDDKPMLIIDAMPLEASYNKAHIPGAKQFLFPIPDMKEWNSAETENRSLEDYQALLGNDKEIPIVVYCGFVKCTRSHNAAIWAKKLGFNNVYRYPGGIYAWQGAGYAIASQ